MKNVFLFFFLLLLAIACKKTPTTGDSVIIPHFDCSNSTNEINVSKELIKGTWHWSSETVRNRGQTKTTVKTPKTEGHNKELVFTDSLVNFYENSLLTLTSKYTIDLERKISFYDADITPVILFKKQNESFFYQCVYFKICRDSLFLDWSIRSDLAGREIWYKK